MLWLRNTLYTCGFQQSAQGLWIVGRTISRVSHNEFEMAFFLKFVSLSNQATSILWRDSIHYLLARSPVKFYSLPVNDKAVPRAFCGA